MEMYGTIVIYLQDCLIYSKMIIDSNSTLITKAILIIYKRLQYLLYNSKKPIIHNNYKL